MIGCPSCGAENVEGTRFCVKCGTTLPASPQPESWRQSGDLGQQQPQQDYPSSGYSAPQPPPSGYPSYTPQQDPLAGYQQQAGDWMAQGANKKIAAGICGILLGGFGVHKYILGLNSAGTIMLCCTLGSWLITLVTCGFGGIIGVPVSLAVSIIGIVEGIIYLTKSDAEFYQLYVVQKKQW